MCTSGFLLFCMRRSFFHLKFVFRKSITSAYSPQRRRLPQNYTTMEKDQLILSVVKSEDFEEALDIFWKHFMPNEPVTGLIGCHTAVGYRIYNLDFLLREMLQSQTCFMAKDHKGNIIGIAFCTVILKKDDTTIHELPTRDEYLCQGWPVDFTHILLLLDHLGYHPNIMNDKKVNQLLDIFAVVVKPNYRRMGIATQLITKAITEAQLVDIPLVTVVCTSAFTQRCCAKLGFNAENTIFYKDWHYKNIKIFDNNKIDPVHPAAISYYKYI